MSKKVLITGGGTATALSVVKGLRMRPDIDCRVYVGDPSPQIAARYLADGYLQLLSASDPNYCQNLLEQCLGHGINLLIPVFDGEFEVLSAAKEQFTKAGIQVAIASPQSIAWCRDKRKSLELFSSLGLHAPTTYQVKEALLLEEGAYPLFVKPADGRGSIGIFRTDSPQELQRALQRCDKPIVQTCIEGNGWSEVTIDCLSSLDGKYIACLPRIRQVVKAGQSYQGLTFRNPQIEEACEKICNHLNLVGATCIQCFYKEGEAPLFIEINPRFGAATILSIAAGLNGPAYLVESLSQETPPAPEGQAGVQMMRYWQEVFVDTTNSATFSDWKLLPPINLRS